MRRWATCLPCQETKQYLGNFLSVYRVRPAADANENSDDENADEPLELSADMLSAALQTQEPFQTTTKTTPQGSTQSIISASGFQLAETTWSKSATKTAAAMERTGYEELDPKALQRAARVTKVPKPQNPPVSKGQSPPCTTATTCATESRAQKVLAWAESLPKALCNPEQRQFCSIVAARVAAELRGEPNALAMNDPLRWVLHGGPGTGKSYTLNLIRKGLFEETLGWQQGVEYQVVTFQA
ncbi:MAG: hypothetical protein OIF54_10965, partial [Cohaesibacter sp.]|nr:hypothetical protein [Cohaesibacter sp.]